jgi:transposase
MKKKPRRSFTREYKLEAVRQVVEQNRPIAQVARELGIGAGLLGQWKQHFLSDPEGSFPGKGRLKPAEEELRRLERENRELRLELEFVKKTAAYFAKERSRGSR